MIHYAQPYEVFFKYYSSLGVPVSGAAGSLSACVSKDGGAATPITGAITEPFAATAPGLYRFTLSETETTADSIAWFAKDVANIIIGYGSEQTQRSTLGSNLNDIADAILRRSIASVETSSIGDTVSLNSLLGAVLIHINGQQIQCNATQTECYLPIKTLGGSLLGSIPLRVVNGNIVGDCGCT